MRYFSIKSNGDGKQYTGWEWLINTTSTYVKLSKGCHFMADDMKTPTL